jgi:hypothetical protein
MGIGNADPTAEVLTMDVKGLDVTTGASRLLTVSSDETPNVLAQNQSVATGSILIELDPGLWIDWGSMM